MATPGESRVLVTGAGGWLASHTVWQLLEAGYNVRGTVRDLSGSKYAFLKEEGFHPKVKTHLELVEADLLRPDDWDAAVDGCDFVCHMASPFKMTANDVMADIITPAVDGVNNVFQACLRHKSTVRRIVMTSSVVSVVYGHPKARYECDRMGVDKARDNLVHKLRHEGFDGPVCGSTGREWSAWPLFNESEFSVEEKIEGYDLSKLRAEKLAWKIINKHNESVDTKIDKIELVVLCPAFVFGPCLTEAHKEGESSQQILRLLNRDYAVAPPITSSHVDVRDAALCHVKALEGSSDVVAGERFIIAATDGNLSFGEQASLLDKFFCARGFRIPTWTAPTFLFSLGSIFSPMLQVIAARAGELAYVSNDKATAAFGIKAWRSTELALKCHALSLMKFGVVQRRGVSQSDIDACPTTQ